MAFYICMHGKLAPHSFSYIEDKSPQPGLRKPGEVYARDIMSKALVTISPRDTIKDAEAVMQKHDFHHLPLVVDKEIRGVVSRHDLARGKPEDPVSNVMSSTVLAANEGTPILHLAQVFIREDINCVPILDQDLRMIGIVTHRDVFRWLINNKKFQKG